MSHLEAVVRERKGFARTFIDAISEQMDDQVRSAQEQLSQLQALRAKQAAERDEFAARLAARADKLAAQVAAIGALREQVEGHFRSLRTNEEELSHDFAR